MYFGVILKMNKSTLFCYFTRIVFIKLNFTVAFLLIRKTWDHRFAGKGRGDGGFYEMGGILVTVGKIFKWEGVDTPLRTVNFNVFVKTRKIC